METLHTDGPLHDAVVVLVGDMLSSGRGLKDHARARPWCLYLAEDSITVLGLCLFIHRSFLGITTPDPA